MRVCCLTLLLAFQLPARHCGSDSSLWHENRPNLRHCRAGSPEKMFFSGAPWEAGTGMQTGLAIRPGNRETESVQHPLFHSLHDIITVCP
ncbi:MAG: hypothetical protein JWO89_2404 [Verrucomicrobiaceae bacterium]|nr:hypothetical protein [Verrucomicrobiaceae bacterium]